MSCNHNALNAKTGTCLKCGLPAPSGTADAPRNVPLDDPGDLARIRSMILHARGDEGSMQPTIMMVDELLTHGPRSRNDAPRAESPRMYACPHRALAPCDECSAASSRPEVTPRRPDLDEVAEYISRRAAAASADGNNEAFAAYAIALDFVKNARFDVPSSSDKAKPSGRKQEVIEQLCKMMGRAWQTIDPNAHEPCDCVCDPKLASYQNAGHALTFMEEAISSAIATRERASSEPDFARLAGQILDMDRPLRAVELEHELRMAYQAGRDTSSPETATTCGHVDGERLCLMTPGHVSCGLPHFVIYSTSGGERATTEQSTQGSTPSGAALSSPDDRPVLGGSRSSEPAEPVAAGAISDNASYSDLVRVLEQIVVACEEGEDAGDIVLEVKARAKAILHDASKPGNPVTDAERATEILMYFAMGPSNADMRARLDRHLADVRRETIEACVEAVAHRGECVRALRALHRTSDTGGSE